MISIMFIVAIGIMCLSVIIASVAGTAAGMMMVRITIVISIIIITAIVTADFCTFVVRNEVGLRLGSQLLNRCCEELRNVGLRFGGRKDAAVQSFWGFGRAGILAVAGTAT